MHRFALGICLLLALCALPLTGCDKHAADKQAIREVFDQFDVACINHRGDEAAGMVTSTTIEYYQRVVANALSMPEDKVRALSWGERCETLNIRHNAMADKDDIKSIEKLKGKPLMAFLINKDWLLSDDGETKVRSIRVNRNSAEMETMTGRRKDPVPIYFAKEGDSWLLDMSQNQKLDRYVATMTRKIGMSENELILAVIEDDSGREVDAKQIWKPLKLRTDTRSPLLED